MAESDPKVLLLVARAIRHFDRAEKAHRSDEGDVDAAGTVVGPKLPPAVNVQGRLGAGFTEDEVMEVLRQAGFRSVFPHPLVEQARK